MVKADIDYKELSDEKQRQLTGLEKELKEMKESNTWKIGLLVGTAIKQPLQIPRIIIRIVRAVFRRLIPKAIREGYENRKKKIFGFFGSKIYNKQLDKILESHKDIKGYVIFPPTVDWNMPLFQRPHQLAISFGKKGYLFFYCTGNFKQDKIHGFKEVAENVIVTNQDELLKRLKKPNLLISWANNEPYTEKYDYGKLIYDYIDELDVFHLYGPELVKQHNRLMKNADLVVTTADKLYNEANAKRKSGVILSPNAVDYDHFAREKYIVPADMKKIMASGKPVIGYYGALARWFDYELLKKLAADRPEYQIVVIGPDYDSTMHEHGLDSIQNIHLMGSKDYRDLPDYAHCLDVATIPFKVNRITESTSPVKLFEYMAAGCAIVTTAMHECKKYKSVLIGNDHNDFVSKVDTALTLRKDQNYQDQLKKDALNNTWDARVDQMLKELK